jgi:hypothetical protein
VKVEAKRFASKKSQFKKKEDENTAQLPVEEEETNNTGQQISKNFLYLL